MEDREGRELVLKNVTHTITLTLVNRFFFLEYVCMCVYIYRVLLSDVKLWGIQEKILYTPWQLPA